MKGSSRKLDTATVMEKIEKGEGKWTKKMAGRKADRKERSVDRRCPLSDLVDGEALKSSAKAKWALTQENLVGCG